MKNKKITYLLIVLTVAIWGTIGWKVYQALRKDDIPVISGNNIPLPKQDNSTPSLLLNYRDPFLGGYSEPVREVRVNNNPQSVVNRQPIIEEPEISPNFRYKGVIRVGAEIQAMVSVNGETLLFKANDQVGQFVISNILDDKLVVRMNKKEYTIPLQ